MSSDRFLELPLTEKSAYAAKRLARLRELRSVQMATRTAAEIWDERLSFYIAFYEKLAAQLEAGAEICPAP